MSFLAFHSFRSYPRSNLPPHVFKEWGNTYINAPPLTRPLPYQRFTCFVPFGAPIKAMCHTDGLVWSAREIATMALPAARERHAKNVWDIALRRGSTFSLSHFREPCDAASVARMWFSIVLSLLLSIGSIPTLHLKTFEQLFWTTTWRENSRKAQ